MSSTQSQDEILSECINTEGINTEDVNSESVNTEGINTEDVNSEGVNAEDVNTEGINVEAINTEDINTEGIDVEGINIKDFNIEDFNTEGINTKGINIKGINIEDVNSEGVNTEDVNTEGINVEGINTEDFNTKGIKIEDVNSEGVNTEDVNTEGINTKDVNTEDVNTKGINVEGINVEGINTEDFNTEGINTKDVNTEDVNTKGINAEGINTKGIKIEDVNSEGVNTEDVNTEGINTKDVNTEDVNTKGINAEGINTEAPENKSNSCVPIDDAESENKTPRILLLGLRGCGKTSILKVIFQNITPGETLFIGTTNRIVKHNVDSSAFTNFQICDFPGNLDFTEPEHKLDYLFENCEILIFIIDAQDAIASALDYLHLVVTSAYNINCKIRFEVFIHKVDGLTEDTKTESKRDIHHRVYEDLKQSGDDHRIYMSFHFTSIYDRSIFETFSRVVQKVIPQYATLENFLNIIISTSGIEKAYLFDVKTKMYVATDSTPVDMQSYELCCDMIDVVVDLSNIYGADKNSESKNNPAFDDQSSSLIKINNGTVLYLKEVAKYLALVCILREDVFEKQKMIDFNYKILRKGVQRLFDLKEEECSESSEWSEAETIE